jgi:hypothetical protein
VPDAICALTPEEWQVANDRYDGCALMCLENYQGRLIGNTNSECDRYGIALSAARLPGGFETAQHDAVVDVIASILTEAGPQPATVHPQGLFSQQVDPVRYPQLYDPERDQVSLRDIVPDIAFRTTTSNPIKYAEVKTIHFVRSRYATLANPRAQSRTQSNSTAVERRARRIESDYLRHARQIDAVLLSTERPPQGGPVERRLAQLGPLRCYAVGVYGEQSTHLRQDIEAAAGRAAAREFRRMGTSSPDIAKQLLLNRMRRRIAVVAIKYAANTILNSIHRIDGVPRAARQQRRMEVRLFGGAGDPMDMSRHARATRVVGTGSHSWGMGD